MPVNRASILPAADVLPETREGALSHGDGDGLNTQLTDYRSTDALRSASRWLAEQRCSQIMNPGRA